MTAFRLKHLVPTEDDECQNLIQWADYARHQGFRIADYLVMIPNRVKLVGDLRQRAITMASWKRCGFKKGASDYILAIPTPKYPGLWLEMKRTELSVTSEEQLDFQAKMRAVGYACAIAKGWEEAKEAINLYLHGATV
jgi:hypothetical protein